MAGSSTGAVAPLVPSPRQYHVDWLRVLAVLLLFPFHVSRVFNLGEDFYVKSAYLSALLSDILGFISQWHMQLLFLLAGMSTFYALRKRSSGQYAFERVKRLLVPLVFGFLVLIPPQTWYGAQFNSGYDGSFWHYITSGDFLAWNVQDGGDYYGGWGIGHLWFILVLLLISLVVLPLLLWGRTERGGRVVRATARGLARPYWWLVVGLIIFLFEGLPDPTTLGFFYYLMFFVLGYVVVGDPRFIESAVRHRWPALAAGVALSIYWVLTADVRDSLPDPSFQLAAVVYPGPLGSWLMMVGLLGLGKRYLDRPSPALAYLAEGSYPVYILHQTTIVVLAFYVVELSIGGFAQWLLLLVLAVLLTFGLYEVVRRAMPLRFLFGMKRAGRRRQPSEQRRGEPAVRV